MFALRRGRKTKFALGVASLVAAVCFSGCRTKAPAFEPTAHVGQEILLLSPAVRLGGDIDEATRENVRRELQREIRSILAEGGGIVQRARPGLDEDRLLERLLEAMKGSHSRSPPRLRRGELLPVTGELPSIAGASSSVLAVLFSRTGPLRESGESVPLPSGELIPYPDELFEYEVPTADRRKMQGFSLEIIFIDAKSASVLAHRRVIQPVRSDEDLAQAVSSLVGAAFRSIGN